MFDDKEDDDDDKEECTNCYIYGDIYGYCGDNGDPFCERCWDAHVKKCDKCIEECDELYEESHEDRYAKVLVQVEERLKDPFRIWLCFT